MLRLIGTAYAGIRTAIWIRIPVRSANGTNKEFTNALISTLNQINHGNLRCFHRHLFPLFSNSFNVTERVVMVGNILILHQTLSTLTLKQAFTEAKASINLTFESGTKMFSDFLTRTWQERSMYRKGDPSGRHNTFTPTTLCS